MNELKRYKRGDVRADGMVFLQYRSGCRGGEHWVARAKFEQISASARRRQREYYSRNREKECARQALSRVLDAAKIRARQARYREANRKTLSARRTAYVRRRRATVAWVALQHRVRNLTRHAFSRLCCSKPTKTEELLGCSWQQAKQHIEKQFADGMSWNNRDKWHIDHVIPLSSAYDEYTLSMLCHFTNLKPMWAKDNLSKSDTWHPPDYCI